MMMTSEDSNYKVYVHTNIINDKKYVGITCRDPVVRWGKDGNGYKDQPKFYNAIQKYGWENFNHFILIDSLTEQEALELETFYISYYDSIENGYNILLKGINSYPRYKPVYCLTTQKLYNSIKEAADDTGVTASRIIQNCKGQVGPTKGLEWTYWDIENNVYFPPIKFQPKNRNKDGTFRGKTTSIYCIELNKWFYSEAQACRELNLDKSGLLKALKGARNGINGYHFVREENLDKIPEIMKKKTGSRRKIYCEETGEIFNGLELAATFAGVTSQSVMKNCQGKTKTCNGYHFKYQEEVDIDYEELIKRLRSERKQGDSEEEE